jgi:hypothetical protein
LGTSIKLNTTDSGPWESHDPNAYSDPKSNLFPQGFKTEMGSASLPTYRTAQKFIEKEDLWPMGDVWSYHDWHVNKWPGFQKFQERLDNLYGKSDNANDFLSWAQLENFRAWRAMTEASIGNMWNNTSGFQYWLSKPSWYSTVWQTYTYDHETTGAYFGAKHACEPIHIQMSPTTKMVKVINSTQAKLQLKAIFSIYNLNGKLFKMEAKSIVVPADTLAECFDISTIELPKNELFIMKLTLADKAGKQVSINDYWLQGKGCNDYKSLKNIGTAQVKVLKSTANKDGSYNFIIKNNSTNMALGVKLNLVNTQTNQYILPALFSDGFFAMLPNEERTIQLTDCNDMKGYEIKIEGLNIK